MVRSTYTILWLQYQLVYVLKVRQTLGESYVYDANATENLKIMTELVVKVFISICAGVV